MLFKQRLLDGNFFLFQAIMHTHILSLSKIKIQFYKIKQLVSNRGDLIYRANPSMFKIYYKLKKSVLYLDKTGITSPTQEENEIEK